MTVTTAVAGIAGEDAAAVPGGAPELVSSVVTPSPPRPPGPPADPGPASTATEKAPVGGRLPPAVPVATVRRGRSATAGRPGAAWPVSATRRPAPTRTRPGVSAPAGRET